MQNIHQYSICRLKIELRLFFISWTDDRDVRVVQVYTQVETWWREYSQVHKSFVSDKPQWMNRRALSVIAQRIVIKFFNPKKNVKPTQIRARLRTQLGNETLFKSQVLSATKHSLAAMRMLKTWHINIVRKEATRYKDFWVHQGVTCVIFVT